MSDTKTKINSQFHFKSAIKLSKEDGNQLEKFLIDEINPILEKGRKGELTHEEVNAELKEVSDKHRPFLDRLGVS